MGNVRDDRGGGQGEEQAFRAFFRDTMLRAMSMQDPAPEATAWPDQDAMLTTGRCSDILASAAPALQQLRALNLGRALRGKDAAYRQAPMHLVPTLESSSGQILSQSPTDATRFWWHLYGS